MQTSATVKIEYVNLTTGNLDTIYTTTELLPIVLAVLIDKGCVIQGIS